MGSKSCSSRVMTCIGVACWGVEEEWRVEEIQVDPPKGREVMIKKLFAGVCHSDILCSQGFPSEIQLDELLTHEMKLEDVPRAHEILKRSDCIKIVIKI